MTCDVTWTQATDQAAPLAGVAVGYGFTPLRLSFFLSRMEGAFQLPKLVEKVKGYHGYKRSADPNLRERGWISA